MAQWNERRTTFPARTCTECHSATGCWSGPNKDVWKIHPSSIRNREGSEIDHDLAVDVLRCKNSGGYFREVLLLEYMSYLESDRLQANPRFEDQDRSA